MLVPIILITGGLTALATLLIPHEKERDIKPEQKKDVPTGTMISVDGLPAMIGAEVIGLMLPSTGYSMLDKLLPDLKKASDSSKIPLGLLVGWIAKESVGPGKIAKYPQDGPGDTSLDERGFFQLMKSESDSLAPKYSDHKRLSTDKTYSINAGLALIGQYMGVVDKLGIAPKNSDLYWILVKLCHSMGDTAVKKFIAHAKQENKTNSWDDIMNAALTYKGKPSAKKWTIFCDEVFSIGKNYGFKAV